MQDDIKIEFIKKMGFSRNAQIHSLPSSGSSRKFYRIKEAQKSAILIQYELKDLSFVPYIEISEFLYKIGVGVPKIYYYDMKNKFIIEEDLGDFTLQTYLHKTKDFEIYKLVIETLSLMQIKGQKGFSICKSLRKRKFNYHTFRWESWYFRRYFIEMYCGLKTTSLEDEFHRLARELASEPLYFMHRDFQSQNILLKNNKIRILDFQGAYQGLLAYDLASLLKDAYVKIEDEVRNKLVDYYLHHLQTKWEIKIKREHFYKIFLYTGLQRNMQALGAFAYLSGVKHKPWFSQYIPQAIEYLYTALSQTREFPKLFEVVATIREENEYRV